MIAHIAIAVFKSFKILSVLLVISAAALAAGEVSSNRTLIIISAITSGTSLLGVIISGAISLHNARKLTLVADLPQKVEEFRKEVDGRMTELKDARRETSEARQEVARGEGKEQERSEERERQAASTPVPAPPATPLKMEIVNPKSRPVPTVPGSEEPNKSARS